ncbi:hypothetical protein Dimus_014428 [Dionaea muscipula]
MGEVISTLLSFILRVARSTIGTVISTLSGFFLRVTRSRKLKAADKDETERSSPGKEHTYYVDIDDSIDALSSSSLQHNARPLYQEELVLPSTESHEASNINPTSGSCNTSTADLVLGSSILINLVDDEEDRRRSCVVEEIIDVVVVSEEALPREADHGLGKEDFIQRPVVWRKKVEIRRKGPYASDQKILLVGEGDFSFSACLAVAFSSATNMVATSLDSREFLCENYKRAMRNILELTNRGCAVMHEIDATKMARKYSPLHAMQFDRIIFNFPHAGVFKKDAPQLRKHRKLVRMFLANAKMMIKVDGEIHIRHKSNGFFCGWNIQQLGENEGLRLIEAVPFNRNKYEGYDTKYGFGGDRNFDCCPSNTYKFGLSC